jgi:threonine/homoserine/homoserine lactone efflux protein
MVTLVAPVVVHSSVVLIPGPTLAGLARKEVITGRLAGATVVVAVALAVPKELVAVKV